MSLDYSDYEGCDIVHDMNNPVDPIYHDKFDVVVDGGSLEHIFNLPAAIKSYMQMVKKGGSLFIFTVANNHTGHGFYQISPELFFRIFQSDNGYEIRDVILEEHPFPGAELSPWARYFSVTNPSILKKRVGLVSMFPVMIMVHAVRTETQPVFAKYPIQSDYTLMYDNSGHNIPASDVNFPSNGLFKQFKQKLMEVLPVKYKNFIYGIRQLWFNSFSNRNFYKKWRPL